MATLERFGPPGGVRDASPAEWSKRVKRLVAAFDDAFPQFYDPSASDTPTGVERSPVVWSAFPAALRAAPGKRLQTADSARRHMDEYCEWGVERNRAGKITRVTFTTEVPEYYDHLFEHDRPKLLELYKTLVSPKATERDLVRNRRYVRANPLNSTTQGRPAHLIQTSNSLEAAIRLAAEATVRRVDAAGTPVTSKQGLVVCGGLGNPFRNSDPQIAAIVNAAARDGAEITLSDPLGLYLDGLMTGGMATPDGANPGSFWTVERGRRGHAVRAAFEVPKERRYTVGDIKVDGRPIKWGGQVAQRVRIRLDALVKPGDHAAAPQPCVA